MVFDEDGQLYERFVALRGKGDAEGLTQFGMDMLKKGLQELEVALVERDKEEIDLDTLAAVLALQGIRITTGLPALSKKDLKGPVNLWKKLTGRRVGDE